MPSGGRIIDVQSAIARGDLSAAERLLSELHIEAPENSPAEHAQLHCDFADCLERSGDPTSAAAHYRHALELRPDDVDATLSLGLVLAQVGAQQEALRFLKRAVGLAPNSFRAWRAYGMQLWSAGLRDAAADAIANALAISPDSPELTRAAAELETERGRPSVALFKRARLLNPKNLDLILGEAVSLCERGNAADAIESLKRATAAHPSWIKGHGALAQLRWQGGEREHFAESFRRALEREPANLDLLKGYFSTLMRAGHYATVLAALPGARVHIEASALFDRYEAICAGESNDVARAEAAFARQLNSRDWDLHVAHVRHYLRTGRIQEAARLGEQIADERPSTAAWAYLSLAWRLLKDPRSSWLEGAGRFVKIYDPPELRSSLGALADVLRRLHAVSQHSFDQSPRGGTQSDGDLFSRALPEIEAMSKHVQAMIDAYIAELPPLDARHPFLKLRHSKTQRAASYSIWLRSGGFHVNHMHPRAWISCSFYVDVPPSIGEDTADPAGWFVIGQPPRELRLDLPATALIQPRPGRLVVFPSMMWHGSLPFESGERLAVVADYAAAPP